MMIRENIALSENGFVFNPSTGDSFTLNNTGREVMMLIRKGLAIKDITNRIEAEYDIDRLTLERYIDDFISDLQSYNLLEDVK